MEEDAFPAGAVAPILEDSYVEARLHTDGKVNIDEILELQRELTGSLANPYYVLQDPDSKEVFDKKAGWMPPEDFAKFLRGPVPYFQDGIGAAE